MLLNNWRNQIEKLKKKSRDKWQLKHNDPKPMQHSKSSSKREVYSNTILPSGNKKKNPQTLIYTSSN